jgi:hypothetical protein
MPPAGNFLSFRSAAEESAVALAFCHSERSEESASAVIVVLFTGSSCEPVTFCHSEAKPRNLLLPLVCLFSARHPASL